MQPQPIQYHTYMLRVWTEPQVGRINGKSQQRFVLSDTSSGEQWGFSSLFEMRGFLETLFPEGDEIAFNVESTACV